MGLGLGLGIVVGHHMQLERQPRPAQLRGGAAPLEGRRAAVGPAEEAALARLVGLGWG